MTNLKLSMEVWPNMPWGRLEICGCAVNSWGKIPLNELVYKVKEHGYEGMDIIYSKIAEIPPDEKPEIMRKTKEALKETGVHLQSLGAHCTFVTPRWFDAAAGVQLMTQCISGQTRCVR